MKQIGFRLDDSQDTGPTIAALALAERPTAVQITSAMLDNAAFLCGTAALAT